MRTLLILLIISAQFLFFGCSLSHDGHNHSHETEKTSSKNFFKTELKSEPTAIKPNETVKFAFSVKDSNGETVRDFDIVHEKPFHLLIVSEDLAEFYHEHPTLQTDGNLTFDFTFKNGGKYVFYADYKPKGATQTTSRLNIVVNGNERSQEELTADGQTEKTVDGLRVVMKTNGEIEANKELYLNFSVFDAVTNQPVNNLENYLGEKAHFVIISKDLKDFVHAHPLSADSVKNASVSESEQKSENSNPATVLAHVSFPNSGLYKVWVQFQRQGKVITVPFTVDVKQSKTENSSTTSAIPEVK